MMSDTIIRDSEGNSAPFDEARLTAFIHRVVDDFPHLKTDTFISKTINGVATKDEYTQAQITNLLVLNAVERINQYEPDWTFVASRIYAEQLYTEASIIRGYNKELKYGSFLDMIKLLREEGIYGSMFDKYSDEEIQHFGKFIAPERDRLLTYIGLRTLTDRYLAKDYDKHVVELPQERWMVIAMAIMQNEPQPRRTSLILEAYWALSNLYMTVATPTMSNAGKSYGQLSSCFIDTVDDSLDGIMLSNMDVARASKDGGGLGVYLGKIRGELSDIKNHKGVASGIMPWMKQLNNTAVSVDQLGQRQGSISVYLDVWHIDIFAFLDAKLNNGDERKRTHDLFTGLCIPDIFMEAVEAREEWYLFDPHDVQRVMGYSLEDSYDEEKGKGTFRTRYAECVQAAKEGKFGEGKFARYKVTQAIEIAKRFMKSQLETGTPFMFYRDAVNRANPNSHVGLIYATNLCTEITQNMSATTIETEQVVLADGEHRIIVVKKPGDFVVCNLSSINLGRAVMDDVLERLIPIQVRMLDNVIDINTLPIPQAGITNGKYRAIGLGTFGWHHLLALKGIRWESEEAVEYCDDLYELISLLTIESSMGLAIEKGAYPVFEGSDWETGAYFEKRKYFEGKRKDEWNHVAVMIEQYGIRNGYLMAIAPNASTSVIAGSTASIDPIFNKEYSEEKKDYKIPVTAPDINAKTTWLYKSGFQIDQKWSILQNARRQRHIDQAISFNLYVENSIKAKELLDLHLLIWQSDIKTTYYTRNTSKMKGYDECESCQ
jgi:ribonucleoside-diphosphate reductase alpha chain